ncbi:hypothetical protein [Arsenicicoccus sp. oral taxon 190]|uniref:hypothetical protein n=1 Tax=Arsenicicoccus sp. oral taxon 190 TaxID=1658671 RepID=UPI00067A355D|nr:hypothetical protein [Arsenicicoccus sp. oral taxon 190]AKT51342.1 hypothetical protein ADJ73_08425 [Arsenicicoccus sp. oral taxon 190]
MTEQQQTARRLMERHGRTFAADAGIALHDKPSPLWQLLVLSLLLSTRIRSEIAVATARELWEAGWRTPEQLRGSTWQPQVRPVLDDLTLRGAQQAGLPSDPAALAGLVDRDDLASLAAALVRVARDPHLLEEPAGGS